MIDILFIHANSSKKVYQDLSNEFSAIEPPIWAGMLAKACDRKGFSSEIIDCEALGFSEEDALIEIGNFPSRVICFVVYGQQPSASTQNMEGAVSLAKKVKEWYPEEKILFVGGHVAALPYETLLNHEFIDFVCQNEGVYTILKILRSNLEYDLHKIDGLGYRDNDHIILNKPSPIVSQDFLGSQLPGIAWNKLPMGRYRTSLWHSYPESANREKFASIYTSLGCPFKCHFCMINIINRKYGRYSDQSAIFRYWKPEFIIKEFDTLAEIGIKNIKIADEMFVLYPRHFIKLCELLIERDYGFNIWCYARIDTIKKLYLKTLKRAGINFIALGIESADKWVRSDVVKGKFDYPDIEKIVREIRNEGINVAANYIFGLPEDNNTSMISTFGLALKLNTEMANFYTCMAYPGSPLYKTAITKGWKLPDTYAGYSQHSYHTKPLPTNYITAKQVLSFRDFAWKKYHENPEYLEMIKNKFGLKAHDQTLKSINIKLKRKLFESKEDGSQ